MPRDGRGGDGSGLVDWVDDWRGWERIEGGEAVDNQPDWFSLDIFGSHPLLCVFVLLASYL